MVAPPDDSIPEGAVRKPPLPPVRGTSHHLKDGAYVFESTVQQPTLCCLADHTHSGGRFQTCPHPPPWRADAPNDGFHPRTAPCGPAARAPRRNAHPFTHCCRADHTRHRMHRGVRFQTCPHPPPWRADAPNDGFHPRTAPYGPAARAPRRNAHPFTRCCRADHTRHRMHRGGRFQTCPHYGVLMRQTMGSTRAPHHAGQRPALPGAMRTRSPVVVAPIIPVTACIVGAGFKPAPTMVC